MCDIQFWEYAKLLSFKVANNPFWDIVNTHFACKKVPYFFKEISILCLPCLWLDILWNTKDKWNKKVDVKYELLSSASVIVIYVN